MKEKAKSARGAWLFVVLFITLLIYITQQQTPEPRAPKTQTGEPFRKQSPNWKRDRRIKKFILERRKAKHH